MTLHEDTIGALPSKAGKAKKAKDIVMAEHAKEYQNELYIKNGKQGSRCSISLILEIKTLWETGAYTTEEMAEIVDRGHQTVKSVVAALNRTQFKSPAMKALAIKATKDILKSCPDDNTRLKAISMVFPDEQPQQASSPGSVNINIKSSELALKNPDYKYEDMDTF